MKSTSHNIIIWYFFCQIGELTQRLVAGLMEENAINPGDVDDATKKGSGGDSSDTENVSAKGQLIKSLNITNAENLEARVRKELEEQGILDPNDDAKEADHDEILEELTRCQNELKALSNHNLSQLVSVSQCGNYRNSLSHFFGKNNVKSTVLLKKLLDFTKFLSARVNFS